MGVKTFVKQCTSAQNSTDPSDKSLAQLAVATKNFVQFQDVMTTIWKRINSPGKEFIHIQKALYCLKYLLIHGSEQVITEARVHAPEISTLTDFYSPQAFPDNGSIVRERAHEVMKLLNDEDFLKESRANARA